MKFNWGDEKNKANIKKHDISFEEAKEIFLDPLHISLLDKRFDYFEERWISIGTTGEGKIIIVGHMYWFDVNREEAI